MEKIFHANEIPMKAGRGSCTAILISDKIDFKSKTIAGDKGSHYMMIKASINQACVIYVNIYAPNIRTSNLIK